METSLEELYFQFACYRMELEVIRNERAHTQDLERRLVLSQQESKLVAHYLQLVMHVNRFCLAKSAL